MQPDFYRQNTIIVAKGLLGTFLIHATPDGITAGRIVETEAYLSMGDLANHALRGQTKRNSAMFSPPGRAYIYFTYGMHWLINVVTGDRSTGEAVLIRALEPIDGLELMRQRRGTNNPRQLCNGPAKLVQAMGIVPSQNNADLSTGPLTIQPTYRTAIPLLDPEIISTSRIGITQSTDLPLRFYLKDNAYISKP